MKGFVVQADPGPTMVKSDFSDPYKNFAGYFYI